MTIATTAMTAQRDAQRPTSHLEPLNERTVSTRKFVEVGPGGCFFDSVGRKHCRCVDWYNVAAEDCRENGCTNGTTHSDARDLEPRG